MLYTSSKGEALLCAGLLAGRRWRASLVMYSAAVSVKMNVLLMAPPVLVVMLKVSPGPRLPHLVLPMCCCVCTTCLTCLGETPSMWHVCTAVALDLGRIRLQVWAYYGACASEVAMHRWANPKTLHHAGCAGG